MNIIRITKKFDFETGHALYGYDGKCKNIHGHSYKLFVTVQGTPITDTSHVKYGMVIDFTDLKKIVNDLHKKIFYEQIKQKIHITNIKKTDEPVDIVWFNKGLALQNLKKYPQMQ